MPSRADVARAALRSAAVSVAFMPAAGSSSARSFGLGRERARDLEPALVAVRRGACARSLARVRDADVVEQLVARAARSPLPRRACARRARSRRTRRRACARAGRSSRSRARTGWRRGGCSGTCARCRARRPRCGFRPVERRAVEHERAAVGRVDAGEHVEERRLARAVRADQAVDLAAADREARRRTAPARRRSAW